MSTTPQQPKVIVVFLDQQSNAFRVCSDHTLQLAKTGDGVTSLGFVEFQPKKLPDGTPLLNGEGKPEVTPTFISLLQFPVEIVPVKKKPAIELATSIPDGIPVPTKKSRQKKSVQ